MEKLKFISPLIAYFILIAVVFGYSEYTKGATPLIRINGWATTTDKG
jgi:hypothetical protein